MPYNAQSQTGLPKFYPYRNPISAILSLTITQYWTFCLKLVNKLVKLS